MTRRIDEIELVLFAVLGAVAQAYRAGLDGNAALPFKFHAIENLIGSFARADRAGELQQPVGQSRLTMVDMGDNGKISNMIEFHLAKFSR